MKTYQVQLPKSNERIRVGVFARFKDKGILLPRLLEALGEFKSKHNAPLNLIRPQIAEMLLNPVSMFPDMNPRIAISTASQSGLSNQYPYEEGFFPTSTLFVYSKYGESLPREVASPNSDCSCLIVETGKYSGKTDGILIPGISEASLTNKSLIVDGDVVRSVPEESMVIPFPEFPGSSGIFTTKFNTSDSTKNALRILGGNPDSRDSKTIERVRGTYAGIVMRFGKATDNKSRTTIFMNAFPPRGFNFVLVEIPKGSLDAFNAYAPANMQ